MFTAGACWTSRPRHHPSGTPSIALKQRVGGVGVSLAETGLGLGDALGDGLTRALAGKEVAVFDELGAPFWYSLGSLADAAEGPSARAQLRGFMSPAHTSGRSRLMAPRPWVGREGR